MGRQTIQKLLVIPILGILALALSLTAGCGSNTETLTIYSGRTSNLVGPILERFSQESGISIEVRYGNSADLALLIAEEGDKTPADVFFSQSPGAVGFLAEEGMLTPIGNDVLNLVDTRLRNKSGLWVGVTGRQRVLVYNSDQINKADLPSSVFDLTSQPFAGRVAIAPQNGSFQDFVTAMRHIESDERAQQWLCNMAESDAPLYPNNNSIVDAVSRGEVEMGLVNHYYNFRFLAEEPSLPSRNHLLSGTDVGALLIVSAATILQNSDNQLLANEFISFLLSEQAQKYFANETFEYPLVPGVEPAAELPPLESLELPDYDIEKLGSDLKGTAKLISDCGLIR